MLIIYLFLIALIAVAVAGEQIFLSVEKTESVPVPAKVNETKSFRYLD
ncbi:MAG: hypothetical protein AB4206_03030 [Xenococcaceae cyanobacterium]